MPLQKACTGRRPPAHAHTHGIVRNASTQEPGEEEVFVARQAGGGHPGIYTVGEDDNDYEHVLVVLLAGRGEGALS